MDNPITVKINDKTYPLRLSMGALSALEEHFEVKDIISLTGRLAHPAAHDIVAALTILIRASGVEIDKTIIAQSDLNPITGLRAIVALFQDAVREMAEVETGVPGKPSETPADGVSTPFDNGA